MRIGVTLPNYRRLATAENIVTTARKAELYGLHSVWVTDHIVMPPSLVERMGAVVYEPFTTLAFAAGCTSRVRLGLSVTPITYRHPLLQAKMIATLDQLSAGRAIYGGAAGYTRDEFEALGVDYRHRGAMADEYLQAMVAAWTHERPRFEGRYVQFSDVATEPRPVQQPRPEIWIGGDSDAAFRRAVRFGDGWHGKVASYDPAAVQQRGSTLEGLRQVIQRIREIAQQEGRDPLSVRISLKEDLLLAPRATERIFEGPVAKVVDDLRCAEALGVEMTVFSFNVSPAGPLMEPMDILGEEILAQVA